MTRLWLLVVLLIAGRTPSHSQTALTLPNGVAAGDVTQTSAVLWARASTAGNVTFTLYDSSRTAIADFTATTPNAMQPLKWRVSDLSPQTQYFYSAMDSADTISAGSFRTPAPEGVRAGLRFGAGGDLMGALAPFPALANAAARDLDLFLLAGDTVYADLASPAWDYANAYSLAEFRLKHDETLGGWNGANHYAALRGSTALLAAIDDHEVSQDFAGGAPRPATGIFSHYAEDTINDTPLYENGLTIFHEYMPIDERYYADTGDPRTANERDLYRFVTYGADAAFFVTDQRSFRDAPLADPPLLDAEAYRAFETASLDPARTLFGVAQFDRLTRDLRDAQRRSSIWKFIVVSEPFMRLGSVGAGERPEGYAAERTALLRFIDDEGITNVVFIAANTHAAIVNDLEYRSSIDEPYTLSDAFEVLISPIAHDPPFGASLLHTLQAANAINPGQAAVYNTLPADARDSLTSLLLNSQLAFVGGQSIGLPTSRVRAHEGSWLSAHAYQWAEFDIDAISGDLTVTIYGVPAYSRDDSIARRLPTLPPRIMFTFTIAPQA